MLIKDCKILKVKQDWAIHSESREKKSNGIQGPQPWMLTRRYIIKKVRDEYYDQVPNAIGFETNWLHAKQRIEVLYIKVYPRLKKYLITWKKDINPNEIQMYSKKIWHRFVFDHKKGPILKLYRLNETYVHVTAAVLEFKAGKTVSLVLPIPNTVDAVILKRHITNLLQKSTYIRNKIPFCEDVTAIVEKVWTKLRSNMVLISEKNLNKNVDVFERLVSTIMEDLEEDCCLLSHANEVCLVKAKLSFILPFLKNNAVQSEILPSRVLAEEESKEENKEEQSKSIPTPVTVIPPPVSPVHEEVNKETIHPSTPVRIEKQHKTLTFNETTSVNQQQSVSNKGTDKIPLEGTPSPSSKLSTSRSVGSRVYVEYTNGQYYWGYVGQIFDVSHHYHHHPNKPRVLRYKILFEDGDVLDEVEEAKMYTEAQYKVLCGEKPPPAYPLGSMFSRKKKTQRLQQRNSSKSIVVDDDITQNDKNSHNRKARRLLSLNTDPKDKRKDFLSPIPRKRNIAASTSTAITSENNEKIDETEMSSSAKKQQRPSPASPGKTVYFTKRPKILKPKSLSLTNEGKTLNSSLDKKKMKKDKTSKVSTTKNKKALDPIKLRKRACKRCHQCLKSDCHKCYTCLRNKEFQINSSESKSVCLQKICSNIRQERRAQPAHGFPSGWTFVLESPTSASENQHSPISRFITSNTTNTHFDGTLFSFILFSPTGRKYKCIETAASHAISTFPSTHSHKDIVVMTTTLLQHIGILSGTIVDESNHILIGKAFIQEWVDFYGRNNSLYGAITACNVSKRQRPSKQLQENNNTSNIDDSASTDDVTFTVEYFDESIEFIRQVWKSSNSSWNIEIPKFQHLSPDVAWGGCLSHERKMSYSSTFHINTKSNHSLIQSYILKNPTSSRYWVTPDMRIVEQIPSNFDNGRANKLLPKITMIIRGCKLTFSVKSSSIPNSGLGVFVKCESMHHKSTASPMQQQPQRFHLETGEFIDLGIYAPCRPSDLKHNCLFNLKNYIHSSKCEEWCFNSVDDDYILDITEELTGRVHEEAELHLPKYVNECNIDQIPTIYAQHSPDGFVHYLYGVSHHERFNEENETSCALENNQINLFVDGVEKEVFINYGAEYERIRARKGYSAIPPSTTISSISKQKAPQRDGDQNNNNRDSTLTKTSTLSKETEDFNEKEYVDTINDFCEEELNMCLKYFLDSFLPLDCITSMENNERIDLNEINNSSRDVPNSASNKDDDKKKTVFFESTKSIQRSFNVAYRIERRIRILMSNAIELNNDNVEDDDNRRQHQELLNVSLQFIERLKKIANKIDPLLDPNFQCSSSSSSKNRSMKIDEVENKDEIVTKYEQQHRKWSTILKKGEEKEEEEDTVTDGDNGESSDDEEESFGNDDRTATEDKEKAPVLLYYSSSEEGETDTDSDNNSTRSNTILLT